MKNKYLLAVLLSLAVCTVSFANDGSPKNFKKFPVGLTYTKLDMTLNGIKSIDESSMCITDLMIKELETPSGCKVVFYKDTADEVDSEVTCPGIEKTRITQRLIDKSTMETVSKSKDFSMKTISKFLGKCVSDD
ncbi:hypothetical protein ACNH6C_13855 [Bdellovibrio bacteriovorus]|uniref:hypothetical protein n=1 Tax=Bdellovibrio bacteriovorus TaxID=959 RepID=UPI003A80ECCD